MSHNSFTTVKVAKDLRGGPKDGKRIDYILYRGADGNKLECTRCCVTMGPVPGKSFSYSDHEGVSATFQVTENDIGKTTTEGNTHRLSLRNDSLRSHQPLPIHS